MPGKPKLKPPSAARPFPSDPRVARLKLISLIIFCLLAIGAIVVVLVLPEQVGQQHVNLETSEKKPIPIDPPEKESSQSEVLQARSKIEAERLLGELLKHQARLENGGVKTWGERRLDTNYPEALTKLAEADEHFNKRRFDLSVKGYRETIAMFEQLESSRPERLRQALQAGAEALERLDEETAKQGFTIALALDAANTEADKGLQRARNLRSMLERLEQGQALESSGELDAAQAAYAEAVALDGNYVPAHEHLKRIDALILEQDYQHAISAALVALNQKDYVKSQRHLESARRLRPGSSEVREVEQRVKNAKQDATLDHLRQRASKYEQSEQWDKAVQTYNSALSVDRNANFAAQGKQRAEKFAELNRQVEHYLSQPDRLQSAKPLAHAREVLDATVAVSDAGPLLRDKRERLRLLIDGYNKEVQVVLHSDGKTDVMIFRVGRFGQLNEHRLMLRPGSYTAFGSRPGYRDVRINFNVPLSGKETVVVVRCEEPI